MIGSLWFVGLKAIHVLPSSQYCIHYISFNGNTLYLLYSLAYPLSTVGFYVQPDVVTFTTHPRSRVVLEGSRVELNCSIATQNMQTATNLPHPEIQWLFNGTQSTEVCIENLNFMQ